MKYGVLTLFTVGMLIALTVVGQAPTGVHQQDRTNISVDVSLVDVLFTVTDKRGKSVRNLKQEHFKVYEDDRLQTISNFSDEGNLPLKIALLIDTSGSVRDKLKFEQDAAIKFFDSTVARSKDLALVMSFDTKADVIQDFTDDADSLTRAVRRIRAGGGTSLYDAVYSAVTRKLVGQDARKIMVIITDGDDTASRRSLPEALEAAQRNDVLIYAISTSSTGVRGDKNAKGDDVLQRLADSTGGKVFYPAKASDLGASFNEITDELRFQYALAYSPVNLRSDGAFHRIRIEPSNKRYVVRAREGYFAPQASVGR